MYEKCRSIEEARQDFDKMVDKDDVSWTAVIDKYLEDWTMEEGFSLFSVLMRLVIRTNCFTFAEFLNACADHVA